MCKTKTFLLKNEKFFIVGLLVLIHMDDSATVNWNESVTVVPLNRVCRHHS